MDYIKSLAKSEKLYKKITKIANELSMLKAINLEESNNIIIEYISKYGYEFNYQKIEKYYNEYLKEGN